MFSADDSSNDSVLDAASAVSSSAPPSPTKSARRPPAPLRIDSVGISPKDLVGKVVHRVRRSPAHPTVTLDCTDGTTYQLKIDGYNPMFPGVPKSLEMDPTLDPIFNPPSGQLFVDLTIEDCASITLMDKAYDARVELQGTRNEHWDQHHIGVAFKFREDAAGDRGRKSWHCVWATLAEYDSQQGGCVFRSYDDVYVDVLHRDRSPQKSPRKRRPDKRNSRAGSGDWTARMWYDSMLTLKHSEPHTCVSDSQSALFKLNHRFALVQTTCFPTSPPRHPPIYLFPNNVLALLALLAFTAHCYLPTSVSPLPSTGPSSLHITMYHLSLSNLHCLPAD